MMHWYPFIGIGIGLFLMIMAIIVACFMGTFLLIIAIVAMSLMGLFWPIIVIAVAYIIYKLIKSEKILAPSRPVIRNAEDILSERYAKGELTREQYMQMKEDLKKAP
jgi:putative membrane protein